jgi:three-Cys-motif partner protein
MLAPILDPVDNMEVMAVREWALEKHEFLTKYIDTCRNVRKRFSQCEFVDLYCGPGRVSVVAENEIRDGGVLSAWQIATAGENPFSLVNISDANPAFVETCKKRLIARGAKVFARVGDAETVASRVAGTLNQYGFHVVYLDPYNTSALPFEVFKPFLHLKHVDFIVHFSNNDVQRNLERAIIEKDSALHRFAPGWEKAVQTGSKANMRRDFMLYWLSLFKQHGFNYAHSMPLMQNTTNAPLYSLVLISRSDLAIRMWNDVANKSRQKSLL